MRENVKKDWCWVNWSLNMETAETGWYIINLVDYRVLMTYYYMPSFHTTWIEVWLYNPMDVKSWQMPCTCSKMEQKKSSFSWLVHTTHFTLVLMADMYVTFKSLCFQKGKKDTNKDKLLRWFTFSKCLSWSFLRVLHSEHFKADSWDGPASQTTLARTSNKPST